ncbi:HAMP domain-containing sensor histidine kinase [Streptomyces phyllanthi]|uniref:histidine kinase n=1 Tax=Streptomyces phyllanthi TaxID=1803180 RepID=A0A5N8WHI3_9ACTN|nr:HAMP domain-containing sensor histidine kinase [Streptomyces phyllanthi]MPY46677.1 HAMP domain-containing histidine kinase [Streptomyces phyllanthi]
MRGLNGGPAGAIGLVRPGLTRTRTRPPRAETRRQPSEPGRGRTARRAVLLWLAATLATLGALAALSAGLLAHYLVERADEELLTYGSAPLPADIERFALLDSSLILVLDARGRIVERYSGDRALPSFPSLTSERLESYAEHGRPVPVGTAYRALVVREAQAVGAGHEGTYVVHARSMTDSTSAVHELLRIELAVALPLLALVVVGARRSARRAAEERAEFERRLREFLASAGHELRNPLTTISGYAELARAGGAAYESMRQDALGRVATEVRRMDSLIDELVLLSRLDLGQPLQVRCVDLARLCRDAVEAERDCHPEHRVRLLVAPGEHTVTGDPLRLHQVVANLLTNARVHTPEGTTTTLGIGTEDGHRVIEVTDDGPGVPDELRSRIFDRFVRGEETRAAGSGLGLSIVAAIATAHGGSVTLEPSDRGAWFRIRLPASASAHDDRPA